MKICILGPVETKTCMGGVAIFDIGLAYALKKENVDVFIATDQRDAVSELDKEVPIHKINMRDFRKLIKVENPDYIITQLAYAKYLYGVKTNAVKIYYLHSFFKQSYYGKLKSVLAVAYQKLLLKKCDLVFSNSYFTEMINNDFFGIKSDAVFHVGVTEHFLNLVNSNNNIPKKKNSVFFAGRFIPAKGVDKIVLAAKILKERDIDFEISIAGDGPLKESLLEMAKEYNLNINFLGRISQDEIAFKYLESEVFVSLDASEPYGIVFPEALLSGCKIVCPFTGGQVEYLCDYKEYVNFINLRSPESIADGIQKMFEVEGKPVMSDNERKMFTYAGVAKDILSYLLNYQEK